MAHYNTPAERPGDDIWVNSFREKNSVAKYRSVIK